MTLPTVLDAQLWEQLLKEDAPNGDQTCQALNLPPLERSAKIIAKEDVSISGLEGITAQIPQDQPLTCNLFFKDGQRAYRGQCVLLLEGLWKDLLLLERPLLNWLGHFCGIANQAWRFQNAVKHTKCKILDTRKTTPFYRTLEKKAVADGGAFNHRANLSEGMMLKENHLALYDFNFEKAIIDCLAYAPKLHLTVEVSNLDQLPQVLRTSAHRVMLDNFSNEQIGEAMMHIKNERHPIEVEASGNMTLDRVASVAELGVDYISVGALTHSAPHADLTCLMDF